jgi:dephospho-CoA kinase
VILVGLTGGIGSGKSTVSALLAAKGAVIVDADAITRELQEPGQPVLAAIVERFGEGVLREDGSLDRAALAAVVFADADALGALNAIVHPAVGAEITRRIEAEGEGEAVVVLDVPLMVESGRYPVDGLIVVDAPPAVALERLERDRGMAPADAGARMARQASRADRLAAADRVIDNSGTLDDLRHQVDDAWDWVLHLRVAGRPNRRSGQ